MTDGSARDHPGIAGYDTDSTEIRRQTGDDSIGTDH